jgi:hypothetical protein
VVTASAILPFLVKVWRDTRKGEPSELGLVWASALTWTTVLNLYVPAYDTPMILCGIVLMATALRREDREVMPPGQGILLVLLFVASWIPALPTGNGTFLQLYTVGLVALGIYQLRLAMERPRLAHVPA